MDFVFDRDRSPLDVPDGKLPHITLGRYSLGDIRASCAYDRNGGSHWLHLNMGVEPHVYFETFREGDRVLKPLLPLDRWPSERQQIAFLVETALLIAVAAKEIPDGTVIKVYTPPLRTPAGDYLEKALYREQLDSLINSDWFSERRLELEVFPRGRPIAVAEE